MLAGQVNFAVFMYMNLRTLTMQDNNCYLHVPRVSGHVHGLLVTELAIGMLSFFERGKNKDMER